MTSLITSQLVVDVATAVATVPPARAPLPVSPTDSRPVRPASVYNPLTAVLDSLDPMPMVTDVVDYLSQWVVGSEVRFSIPDGKYIVRGTGVIVDVIERATFRPGACLRVPVVRVTSLVLDRSNTPTGHYYAIGTEHPMNPNQASLDRRSNYSRNDSP